MMVSSSRVLLSYEYKVGDLEANTRRPGSIFVKKNTATIPAAQSPQFELGRPILIELY
jgi:hypothetical protein